MARTFRSCLLLHEATVAKLQPMERRFLIGFLVMNFHKAGCMPALSVSAHFANLKNCGRMHRLHFAL